MPAQSDLRQTNSSGFVAMTKEQEFKSRFASVLQDLQQTGSKDAETMFLLGNLASNLSGNLRAQNWSSAKTVMTSKDYQALLRLFEQQGNEHHAAGRDKHAFAIQVLAVSLIAHTQRADPQMQAGEELIDQVIDRTVAAKRQTIKKH